MDKDISDAAEAFVRALWPDVQELTSATGKESLPALVTVARPHFRAVLARMEGEPPPDKRMLTYRVSALFWERDPDDESDWELIESTDDVDESQEVHGLAAALEQVLLWIQEMYGDCELEGLDFEIPPKVASLRVSVHRGGGQGNARINFKADGVPCLAHATVVRLEGSEDDG